MSELAARVGRVGLWCNAPVFSPVEIVRAGIAAVEELGFRALWFPESVGGRESLTTAAFILSESSNLVACTGILSVYARDPMATRNGARTLADAHPGRFVLGLGVSHAPSVGARGHDYGRPVPTMRAYLDAMEGAAYRPPEPEPVPTLLAALGPLMLKLAAERTDGAHPYFVPVEHTAFARKRLGPDRLLAPEVAVVIASDRALAREAAQGYLDTYLALENYTNNLRRFGFEDEDLAGSGSDRVLDALVAWGDVEAICTRVGEHLTAGADHVCIQPLPAADFQLEQLRELAPALLEL
ncbi:MAG: TIGR03620 family F420-dependent LLM class oxidoreductase [Gaiellaceae bacterium]